MTYTYDGNGNMTTMIDEDSFTTDYNYDVVNQLIGVHYADGNTISYTYDSAGHIIDMTEWIGITTFEMDVLGRLIKETDYTWNALK